jgi:hypothetical protein
VTLLKAFVPTVGRLPRKETERNLVQVLNALAPILVTELGIVILVKAAQFANVLASMLVNDVVGRMTLDKAPQPEKALVPILVIESGKTILDSAEQFKKAEPPTLATPVSIVTLLKSEQPANALTPMVVLAVNGPEAPGIATLVKRLRA